MSRRAWRPRCCFSCGEPLEEWSTPLTIGAYVPCLPCAVLYVVVDDGLERVLLSLEPPELRRVFDELVQAWFGLQQRQTEATAHRAAA